MKWLSGLLVVVVVTLAIGELLSPLGRHSPASTTVTPVSVATTVFPQAGISIRATPPRPGIYYAAVAIYNPSNINYSVHLGPNQNSLPPLSAALFTMPSTGAAPVLYGSNISASTPLGAYLGPLTVVWFEPDDALGSFPTPLSPQSGITLWTPYIYVYLTDVGIPLRILPSGPIDSMTITNTSSLSDDLPVVDCYGYPSADLVGSVASPASGQSAVLAISPVVGDTSYYLTATAQPPPNDSALPFSGTISLNLTSS